MWGNLSLLLLLRRWTGRDEASIYTANCWRYLNTDITTIKLLVLVFVFSTYRRDCIGLLCHNQSSAASHFVPSKTLEAFPLDLVDSTKFVSESCSSFPQRQWDDYLTFNIESWDLYLSFGKYLFNKRTCNRLETEGTEHKGSIKQKHSLFIFN